MFQKLILVFIWLGTLVASPITNPLRSDKDIGHAIPEYFDSKKSKPFHIFTPNTSVTAQEVLYSIEQGASVEFSLRWSTSLGSPIFSSPVIFPSSATGHKQIFVNTFYQFAELVDSDGYKPWGWPLSFEDSSFQSSPMVYDVDGDGNVDMGLMDKNGNMLWVRIGDSGEYLEDYHVQVPKLRVKRDWAEGLDPSFVDSYVKLSMFDREGSSGDQLQKVDRKKARLDDLQAIPETATASDRRRLSEEDEGAVPDFGENGEVDDFIRSEAERMAVRSSDMYGVEEVEGGPGDQKASLEDVLREQETEGNKGEEAEEMDGTYEYAYRAAPHRVKGGHGTGYGAGAYYADGGDFNDTDYVMVDAHVLASPVLVDINGDGHMEVLVSVSYYFDKAEYAGRQLGFNPDHFVAGGVACWDLDEQRWTWLVHLDLTTALSKFQAMIYAPPTVADLDGDGRTEVIVGTAMGLLYVMDGESGFVRRFFPMQFHSIQAQVVVASLYSVGQGSGGLQMIVLDMGGTVAVVDVDGDILWDAHLSGTLPFPATVGDVDGDGQLDVVVVAATEDKGSHIYVLRGDTGTMLPGFPISLPGNSAVSSPVLLVDLLSLHLRDAGQGRHSSNSNVSVEAMQALHRSATPRRSPLLAGTVDDPFPIEGLLSAENMRSSSAPDSLVPPLKGLHLVVTSYEGAVYLIFGQPTLKMVSTGATTAALQSSEPEPKNEALTPRFHAQRLDVGEHVYSAPLLDDITGDGYLDLLVGTLNGQLLLFESAVPFHPSNAWTSFPNHRLNSVTHGALGIAVPQDEKDKLRQLDVKGKDTLSIAFDIWDLHPSQDSEYVVSVTRGTNRLQPLWKQSFDRPGRHLAHIPVSPPELTLLVFSMKSRHGEYFEDTAHVALSTKFYVWLKYLLAAPIVLLTFTLLSRFRKQAI